jgi:hypothetical protein
MLSLFLFFNLFIFINKIKKVFVAPGNRGVLLEKGRRYVLRPRSYDVNASRILAALRRIDQEQV